MCVYASACLLGPTYILCFERASGEAGTGNVVEAVRHCRAVMGAIKQLQTLDEDELYVYAKVHFCSCMSS